MPLRGAGGFPHRHPDRRGAGRAHPLAADSAIHGHRRDTRQGLVSAPLPGPVRAGGCGSIITPSEELTLIVSGRRACLGRHRGWRARRRSHGASRGTPRIANRLPARVRDYAQCAPTGTSTTSPVPRWTFWRSTVWGWTRSIRRSCRPSWRSIAAEPVGLNTIAASIDEGAGYHRGSLRAVPDPDGFIDRTRAAGWPPTGPSEYFGLPRRPARQPPEHAVLMKTVYLSLGSNLGDREGYLRQAIALIGAAGCASCAFLRSTRPTAGSARPAPVPEPGGEAETETVP